MILFELGTNMYLKYMLVSCTIKKVCGATSWSTGIIYLDLMEQEACDITHCDNEKSISFARTVKEFNVTRSRGSWSCWTTKNKSYYLEHMYWHKIWLVINNFCENPWKLSFQHIFSWKHSHHLHLIHLTVMFCRGQWINPGSKHHISAGGPVKNHNIIHHQLSYKSCSH